MVERTEGSSSLKNRFLEKGETERGLWPGRLGDYSELPIFFRYSEEDQNNGCSALGFCSSFSGKILELWRNLGSVARKARDMGKSDPRKIAFSAKMGLALILIFLLIYLKMPPKDLSRYSLWAILTVVVAFEFSIGATLSKGLSRGLGAISAGGLALAMGELSQLAGDWGVVIAIIGIFVTGFCFTYAKLYPTMKPYKYGFQVFLITCCFIMVSGYQTREFVNTAATQLVLIALGAGISLVVNICIFPVWAGDDLHKLVAKNFMSVANSLEGCINAYLQCVEYERVPAGILNFQASDDPLYSGYRSAIISISQEDALVKFAVWEPPHGPYKMFKYPWRNYVKLSGALRHCASMVMALHGCILSEIQAPAERRQVFRNELQRVAAGSVKVLRELGSKVKRMEKVGSHDILYEVHEAAEELQMKVDKKSYLFVNSESWEISKTDEEPKVQPDYDFLDINDEENDFQDYEFLSETAINRKSVQLLRSLSDMNFNTPAGYPSEIMTEKHITLTFSDVSWEPAFPSMPQEYSKTYENACALSLSTFTFLLIEFVARLQNLVDSFEELSEKAQFKDPANLQEVAAEEVGFWIRIRELFKSLKRDGN